VEGRRFKRRGRVNRRRLFSKDVVQEEEKIENSDIIH
jgi:hypothetical protein